VQLLIKQVFNPFHGEEFTSAPTHPLGHGFLYPTGMDHVGRGAVQAGTLYKELEVSVKVCFESGGALPCLYVNVPAEVLLKLLLDHYRDIPVGAAVAGGEGHLEIWRMPGLLK